jgi:hypothetical protein
MNVSTRFMEWACLEAATTGSTRHAEENLMRSHLTMKRIVLLSCGLSISLWAVPSTHAENPLVDGAMVMAPAEALGVVASGAVEDTLKACLARIPAEATTGQRMLAEQSCAGDEGTKKLIQGAPNF